MWNRNGRGKNVRVPDNDWVDDKIWRVAFDNLSSIRLADDMREVRSLQ